MNLLSQVERMSPPTASVPDNGYTSGVVGRVDTHPHCTILSKAALTSLFQFRFHIAWAWEERQTTISKGKNYTTAFPIYFLFTCSLAYSDKSASYYKCLL